MDLLSEAYGNSDDESNGGGVDGFQPPIPLGGPIYVNDLVSPLIRVADFENAVFAEVQELKDELGVDDDEDVRVDELKVFTEEELVSDAMKAAFEEKGENAPLTGSMYENFSSVDDASKDNDPVGALILPFPKYYYRKRRNGPIESVAAAGKLVSADLSKEKKKNMNKKKTTTKKNREGGDDEEVGYLKRAKELAKIREKQEADKAAAKLRSLNTHHKWNAETRSSRGASVKEPSERAKSLQWLNFSTKVKLANNDDGIIKAISYPEVVLCIEVYHHRKNFQKIQEIFVLGEQTLVELKDMIRCNTDLVMDRAGVYDPSGYFMIEEAFYNDMRHPSSIDYSEPILNWVRNYREEATKKWQSIMRGETKKMKERKMILVDDGAITRVPNFKACRMEDKRFRELEFQLGTGYLYCHQGACKHTIVFRDMRLIHPDDVQNQASYPITAFELKPRMRKCSLCDIYKATKMTVDDRLSKENPDYQCDQCYQLLHYSADNTLLYDDFSVYDYIQ